MVIRRGLKVKIKREMMDTNGLIVPKDTLLEIDSASFEFDSEIYELTGNVTINDVEEKVALWAYITDFTLAEILVN